MIFKIREKTFETYVPKTQYYISTGSDTYLLKDGTIATNASNGWWHTRKEAEIFLAGWQVLNPLPAPKLNQVDFEPEYELGTRYIQYIDGIRTVHRYYKLDGGVIGTDPHSLVTYHRVDYRWIRVK